MRETSTALTVLCVSIDVNFTFLPRGAPLSLYSCTWPEICVRVMRQEDRVDTVYGWMGREFAQEV